MAVQEGASSAWVASRRVYAVAAAQPILLAYLVPTLLAVLAVQTWFVPGKVIAGSDMPPPLAPATAYRSQWNQFGAGEGGPANDIVALPF